MCPWPVSLGALSGPRAIGRPLSHQQDGENFSLASEGGRVSVKQYRLLETGVRGCLGSEGRRQIGATGNSEFPESIHDTCPGPSSTSFSNSLEGSGPRGVATFGL